MIIFETTLYAEDDAPDDCPEEIDVTIGYTPEQELDRGDHSSRWAPWHADDIHLVKPSMPPHVLAYFRDQINDAAANHFAGRRRAA